MLEIRSHCYSMFSVVDVVVKDGETGHMLAISNNIISTDDWYQIHHTIQKLCIICAFVLASQWMGCATRVRISSSSATFNIAPHTLSLSLSLHTLSRLFIVISTERERRAEIPFQKVFESHCYCCAREKISNIPSSINSKQKHYQLKIYAFTSPASHSFDRMRYIHLHFHHYVWQLWSGNLASVSSAACNESNGI